MGVEIRAFKSAGTYHQLKSTCRSMSAMVGQRKERFTTTKDRMVCVTCHGTIAAGSSAVKAGGKFWHQDHFACLECGTSLRLPTPSRLEVDDNVFLEEDEEENSADNISRSTVYQKDGSLYCERDYKRLFVPKCASCGDHIMKDCIKALNK